MITSDSFDDKNLYEILGVSEDADEQEIRARYLKLSRLYHPDRHVLSQKNQEFALQKFPKIEFAKRILLSKKLRSVYDTFGYRGLKLVLNTEEKDIEVQVEKLKEGDLNLTTYVKTHVMTHLNDNRTRISQCVIQSGIQNFITQKLLLRFGTGFVTTNNYLSNTHTGYIDFTLVYFGKYICEFNGLVGRTGRLGASIERRLIKYRSSFKLQLEQMFRKFTIGECTATLNHTFNLTDNWNFKHSIDTDLSYSAGLELLKNENRHYRLDIPLYDECVFSPGLIFTRSKLTRAGFLRKIGATVSLGYDSLSLSLTRKFNESKILLQWESGFNWFEMSPITNLHASIYGFSMQMPLVLPIINPVYTSLYIIAPPILFVTSSVMYDALSQYYQSKYCNIPTKQRKEEILAQAEQAKIEISLMRDSVEQIITEEREINGLIIIEAWYGNLEGKLKDPSLPPMIDVTVPLQHLVSESRLRIDTRESKSCLEGFYDPCVGNARKELWIRYSFQGDTNHTIRVGDNEPFSAPKQKHRNGPKFYPYK